MAATIGGSVNGTVTDANGSNWTVLPDLVEVLDYQYDAQAILDGAATKDAAGDTITLTAAVPQLGAANYNVPPWDNWTLRCELRLTASAKCGVDLFWGDPVYNYRLLLREGAARAVGFYGDLDVPQVLDSPAFPFAPTLDAWVPVEVSLYDARLTFRYGGATVMDLPIAFMATRKNAAFDNPWFSVSAFTEAGCTGGGTIAVRGVGIANLFVHNTPVDVQSDLRCRYLQCSNVSSPGTTFASNAAWFGSNAGAAGSNWGRWASNAAAFGSNQAAYLSAPSDRITLTDVAAAAEEEHPRPLSDATLAAAATASSTNSSLHASNAFDKTAAHWAPSGANSTKYQSNTGWNISAHRTTAADGAVYAGEWLQFRPAYPVVPTSYSLTPNPANFRLITPTAWAVLGSSNAGATWQLVDRKADVHWPSAAESNFRPAAPQSNAYNALRLVVERVGNADAWTSNLSGTCHLAEVKYFANPTRTAALSYDADPNRVTLTVHSNVAATFSSNGTVTCSNLAASNLDAGSLVLAGTRVLPGDIAFGSNAGAWGSNLAAWTSNQLAATGAAGAASVFASNAGAFGSNAGAFGSNAGAFGSNAGAWGSNAGTWGSNAGWFASNAGAFGCNAAVWASNAAGTSTAATYVSTSNVVTSNVTTVTGSACNYYASNLQASNLRAGAVWTSNLTASNVWVGGPYPAGYAVPGAELTVNGSIYCTANLRGVICDFGNVTASAVTASGTSTFTGPVAIGTGFTSVSSYPFEARVKSRFRSNVYIDGRADVSYLVCSGTLETDKVVLGQHPSRIDALGWNLYPSDTSPSGAEFRVVIGCNAQVNGGLNVAGNTAATGDLTASTAYCKHGMRLDCENFTPYAGLWWQCGNTGPGVWSALSFQDYANNGGTGWYFSWQGNKARIQAQNGVYWQLSDARKKNVRGTLKGSLAKVKQMRGVEYTWKDDPGGAADHGFLAQELQAVLPEAVAAGGKDAGGEEQLMVSHTSIIPHLVEAIKELSAKVDGLQTQVDALKGAKEKGGA